MEEASQQIFESKEKPNVLYTAYFVKNITGLLEKFSPRHEKIFGHHSTIEFKPHTLDGIEVGNGISLKIIGRVTDEKGDALLVESPKSENSYSHITFSCAEGVSPMYSNELIKNALTNSQVEYFETPIFVDVTEGYFDGKKDVVEKG